MKEQINLVCLPFAGGNKYSYREYEKYAPEWLMLAPLDYPGRGARVREPFAASMDQLATDLYEKIAARVKDAKYALYGHSMGGIVGYFLLKKIREWGGEPPLHAFFTGTAAPASRAVRGMKRHLLPKLEFIREIRELDGCPEEILQDPELLDYLEPILRADFRISEKFDYEETAPFDIPFTIVTGCDEAMEPEDILSWQKESTRPVDYRQMSGKHFFIFDHSAEILSLITNKICTSINAIEL